MLTRSAMAGDRRKGSRLFAPDLCDAGNPFAQGRRSQQINDPEFRFSQRSILHSSMDSCLQSCPYTADFPAIISVTRAYESMISPQGTEIGGSLGKMNLTLQPRFPHAGSES